MTARPDLPLARRGLRLQAVGRRPAPDRRRAPAARPTRACWSRPTPPTTPASSSSPTTSRSSRPSTSSRRSSTTRTRSGASPRRTRCRTSTRWAARRCRALNLVAYPLETLGPDVLREILRGGADAVAGRGRGDRRRPLDRRPGAEVRPGGHRHRAPGRGAHQRRRPRRRRARADQAARRRGGGDRDQARAGRRRRWSSAAIEVMTTLNDRAAEQARAAGAHALTDVTGFGLLGPRARAGGGERPGRRDRRRPPCPRSTACSSCWRTTTRWPAARAATAPTPRRSRACADGVPEPRRRLRVRRDDLRRPARRGGRRATIEGGVVGRLVAGEPGTIARRASAAGRRASEAARARCRRRRRRARRASSPRAASRRQQHEHDRDREHAEQVGVVLARRARRPSTSRIVQAASSASAAPLAPIVPPCRVERRRRAQRAGRAADEEHEQRRPRAVAALQQPAEQEDRAERDDLVAGRGRRRTACVTSSPVVVRRAGRSDAGR